MRRWAKIAYQTDQSWLWGPERDSNRLVTIFGGTVVVPSVQNHLHERVSLSTDPQHVDKTRFAEMSDEDVFVLFRDGGGESGIAYRVLIERFHDDLLRFLTRLVGDRAAAEDLFQETFLQVHLSADTFDAKRRFRPWLFTIAANKGRDLLRKRKRRRTVELSAPLKGSDRGTSMVDLLEVEVGRLW